MHSESSLQVRHQALEENAIMVIEWSSLPMPHAREIHDRGIAERYFDPIPAIHPMRLAQIHGVPGAFSIRIRHPRATVANRTCWKWRVTPLGDHLAWMAMIRTRQLSERDLAHPRTAQDHRISDTCKYADVVALHCICNPFQYVRP